MIFHSPWAFWLLLLIPVYLLLRWRGSEKGVSFSSVEIKLPFSFRSATAFIPEILKIIAMIFLIVALARPQTGLDSVRRITNGVAMEMVIDHSGSMGIYMDKSRTVNRLDILKKVFLDFVQGDGVNLTGRSNDLIGIVLFARYSDTLSPLTLSHELLPEFIKRIDLVEQEEEDGTSIGDAVALAAARLKLLDETLDESRDKSYQIKSRIIILLTDGANNSGDKTPLEAAEMAKDWGIKIYPIGITGGYVPNAFNILRKIPANSPYGADETTLKEMAEISGGKYFSADSADSLRSVYEVIDSLEKTVIESETYTEYKEHFFPFVLAGFLSFLLSILLQYSYYRRVE